MAKISRYQAEPAFFLFFQVNSIIKVIRFFFDITKIRQAQKQITPVRNNSDRRYRVSGHLLTKQSGPESFCFYFRFFIFFRSLFF